MANRTLTVEEHKTVYKAALYELLSTHRAEFESILYKKTKEILG